MGFKKKIFIAGHGGMVGSAIKDKLEKSNKCIIITRSRDKIDLTDQAGVRDFMREVCPDEIYLAAAKVGGINANNSFPADFIYENMMIQANIIHEACMAGVNKLLFLGSSCIYPRMANQPMQESELLSGYLEPTNEPYAIAKIAGIKLCESYNRQYGVDFRSVMPTNLYGPNDSYHPTNSHVVPGLIRRFHEAKCTQQSRVTVWGTGTPLRELLYVDDMADASIFVMGLEKDRYSSVTQERVSHINVGSGIETSIKDLAEVIAKVVGFQGEVDFDSSKPDGPPRKFLDTSKLASLGWTSQTTLEAGLYQSYANFLKINV